MERINFTVDYCQWIVDKYKELLDEHLKQQQLLDEAKELLNEAKIGFEWYERELEKAKKEPKCLERMAQGIAKNVK